MLKHCQHPGACCYKHSVNPREPIKYRRHVPNPDQKHLRNPSCFGQAPRHKGDIPRNATFNGDLIDICPADRHGTFERSRQLHIA